MTVQVYYHDYTEVDPTISWTGLCGELAAATYTDIRLCRVPAVTRLFEYARPDIVIAVNGEPVLSLEQTRMNPSGHNIPQRFSSSVKAAELGIPSIMYYPAYARRTLSDPNIRWINIRVILAQLRLQDIFQVPCLSVFWPTDPATLLPVNGQAAQWQMAEATDALIANAGRRRRLLKLPAVELALEDMVDMCQRRAKFFRRNRSVRRYFPHGLRTCPHTGVVVDPPQATADSGVTFLKTADLLAMIHGRYPNIGSASAWNEASEFIESREYSMVYTGTPNADGVDSEHPWPGYLTLFDILYARSDRERFTYMRDYNLVYRVDIPQAVFVERLNRPDPPTAGYIVDVFADLLLLRDGVVPGRPIRGARPAVTAVLA